MQASQIPAKIPSAFGSGNPSVVQPIPATGAPTGRVSWASAFTSVNMVPLASGGIPPFGTDMNGVLNAISAWAVWLEAGGPVRYDATFSGEIAGYPQGALLQSADALGFWISTVNDNVSNPDTGGGNWFFVPSVQVCNGTPNGVLAGHAATALSPPSQAWDSKDGVRWVCTFSGPATGGPGVQAVWSPETILQPVEGAITGNTHNYVAGDLGSLKIRSNSGVAMTDGLPSNVANGWWVPIFNADVSAALTLGVPAGKNLNGTLNGTIAIPPGRNTQATADAVGNFWVDPAIPVVFSGQAVYVAISGTYPPGVYHVDTRVNPVVFTLEMGITQGDNYLIRDIYGTFAKNSCTINPGTNLFEGAVDVEVLDVPWSESIITGDAGSPGNWSYV